MKISKFAIVSAVVFLHLAAISLMILQPGCKSSNSKSPTGSEVPPAPAVAANADMTLPAPPPAPAFVPPSRPETPVVPVTIATLNSNEPLSANAINAIGPSAPTTPEVQYEVKSKDSMTTIAKANGVSLHDLEAANPKIDPKKMKVGEILTIPMGAASAPATGTPVSTPDATSELRTHKVISGESLTSIARKEGTTIAALRTANNLKSDSIKVGQELKIPADAGAPAASSTTAAPVAASPGASASAAVSTASAGPGEYVVKSGDSPDSIAKKFGVKTSDLMTLNNISNPLRMQIGQKLKLPSNAKMSGAATSTPADSSPAPAATPVMTAPSPAPVSSAPVAPTPSPSASQTTDVVPVVPVSQ